MSETRLTFASTIPFASASLELTRFCFRFILSLTSPPRSGNFGFGKEGSFSLGSFRSNDGNDSFGSFGRLGSFGNLRGGSLGSEGRVNLGALEEDSK